MEDRVPQARIHKVWNIPQWGDPDSVYLDLAGDVLASGKTSRLYRRLVYEDQVATDVSAHVNSMEIGGLFMVISSACPGQGLEEVEKALDQELEQFLKNGPTKQELKRVKTQYFARFIRGAERIGGFGGKSDVLARSEVYGGSPDTYKETLELVRDATAEDLRDTARKWLSDGQYVLEVHPFPTYDASEAQADRSVLPVPGDPPAAKFPRLQRGRLANGLELVLAERHAIPVVNFSLMIDAGYAADSPGTRGTTSLALAMLDEGTKRRTALEISEEMALLGARISVGSSLDSCYVTLNTLKINLEESLELYADIILNPAFDAAEFERQQISLLARIKQEKNLPNQMGMRVLPALLYGKDHPYGGPMSGNGTEESVKALTPPDLVAFHVTWFKPNNATLVVVGDTTMDEIRPLLERLFKNWRPGDVPKKNIAEVAHQTEPSIYLLDRPGAQQSVVFAGHLAPPKSNPDEIAIEAMNRILGGSFTSRINMNLREDKHWSYGSRTSTYDARGQRVFIALAPVQSDKTKETLTELVKEFRGILEDQPVTQDELDKTKLSTTLRLSGAWETVDAVAGSIEQIVEFGLPDNYFETYAGNVQTLTRDDVSGAAKTVLRPDNLVWIVVGDLARIESGIRGLNYGEVRQVDADGNFLD
jgi:zinc protease